MKMKTFHKVCAYRSITRIHDPNKRKKSAAVCNVDCSRKMMKKKTKELSKKSADNYGVSAIPLTPLINFIMKLSLPHALPPLTIVQKHKRRTESTTGSTRDGQTTEAIQDAVYGLQSPPQLMLPSMTYPLAPYHISLVLLATKAKKILRMTITVHDLQQKNCDTIRMTPIPEGHATIRLVPGTRMLQPTMQKLIIGATLVHMPQANKPMIYRNVKPQRTALKAT